MSLDDPHLSSLIKRHATRHAAPDALRAGIRTQVALAEAGRSDTSAPPASKRRAWFALHWRTAAVSFAMGLACAALVLPLAQRFDLNPALDAELVADHVRALQVGPLIEVASTDRHTVKPWFLGKLDFSPPVADLTESGFPLVGGRLDYLDGRPVAALVYQRQQHTINLFISPADGASAPIDSRTVRGFHVRHWSRDGMSFWAISDLNDRELTEFVNAIIGR